MISTELLPYLLYDFLVGAGIGTVIVLIHLFGVFTRKASDKKHIAQSAEAKDKPDQEVKYQAYPLWLRIILVYVASIIFQLMQRFPFSLFPSLSQDSTLLITSLSSIPVWIIYIIVLVKIFRGKKV